MRSLPQALRPRGTRPKGLNSDLRDPRQSKSQVQICCINVANGFPGFVVDYPLVTYPV